jgi:hypothetical protein
MGRFTKMQFCAKHWVDLRTAIEDRGLLQFVNKDAISASKEVSAAFKKERDEKQPYDPLLSANFAIWTNALRAGGLYMMKDEYCPCCELEKNTTLKAADWINPCCDYILADFRRKGWVPEPS